VQKVVMPDAEAGERSHVMTHRFEQGGVRTALVIVLPSAALSLALHLWAVMSAAAAVNADEAMTGLQAYNVLDGHLAPIVEGNDYGGALESYLMAPALLVTSGTIALKVVPILLSFVFGFAMMWACSPLLGQRVALVVGAVSWASSGASVVLWSLDYMGYGSGAIAMVVALGCAVRAANRPGPALAFAAGLSGGLALWGHPIFGIAAALGCLSVFGARLRLLLYLAVGAFIGASPWLLYLGSRGMPRIPVYSRAATYPERVQILLTELLPSGFGLRSPNGAWLEPLVLTVPIATLLILGALAGLAMLPRWSGPAALPFTIAGLGAIPVLAAFQPLAFSTDGRYTVVFMPMLIVGLFGWSRASRHASHLPLGLAVAIPLVWGVLACVPSIHGVSGWVWQDPNRRTEQAVADLQQRGITAVRGDYWAVYLLDYYSQGQLDSWSNGTQRLTEDAARVELTPEPKVALVYEAGSVDSGHVTLPRPLGEYTLVTTDRWEMWLFTR
jgi:hypothetical protein